MFSGIGGALICTDCIEAGHELVLGMPKEAKIASADDLQFDTLPTPQMIKDFLDQYVIGQEEASSRSLSITTTSVCYRRFPTTM